MNYRERIRKAIECPQFGDETYGEWGALNLEQRKFIKRLLDELDRADNYIKKVYLENQELKLELSGYRQAILEDKDMLGLKEENQELKKQLEVGKEQYNDLVEEKEILQEQLSIKTLQLEELKSSKRDYTQENILTMQLELKNRQQKEFISYLENEIYSIEPKGTGINYNCEYDSEEDYINAMEEQSKLNTFKEILSKYKEIIGDVKSENK